MLVSSILRSKGAVVQTLPASATLADAVSVLNTHNIGAVVITDEGGAIIGILSERDIVRRLGSDPAGTLSMHIADAMTRGVVTCTPDAEIDAEMEQMTSFRIRHVPVAEAGELLGIVSIGDVVKHKLDQAEHETAALRDYISS